MEDKSQLPAVVEPILSSEEATKALEQAGLKTVNGRTADALEALEKLGHFHTGYGMASRNRGRMLVSIRRLEIGQAIAQEQLEEVAANPDLKPDKKTELIRTLSFCLAQLTKALNECLLISKSGHPTANGKTLDPEDETPLNKAFKAGQVIVAKDLHIHSADQPPKLP